MYANRNFLSLKLENRLRVGYRYTGPVISNRQEKCRIMSVKYMEKQERKAKTSLIILKLF